MLTVLTTKGLISGDEAIDLLLASLLKKQGWDAIDDLARDLAAAPGEEAETAAAILNGIERLRAKTQP
jgi:hypothetical protein